MRKRIITRGPGRDDGFPNKILDDSQAMTWLCRIMNTGFGVAQGYCDMSRDRYHIELKTGLTDTRLLGFFLEKLNGSPLPGTDPMRDGNLILGLCRAAEDAGLITLRLEKALQFVPEVGREVNRP